MVTAEKPAQRVSDTDEAIYVASKILWPWNWGGVTENGLLLSLSTSQLWINTSRVRPPNGGRIVTPPLGEGLLVVYYAIKPKQPLGGMRWKRQVLLT